MKIKDNIVIAYAKNGNRKVAIKHECEFCNHATCLPNHFNNGLLEFRCELNNEVVFNYDAFDRKGKYYGLGLAGKKHYINGMKKKSHECGNFLFDVEGVELL